ncbi:uncharacterized protein LOC104429400 isoform X3 [Eucalyptus grandis]|uniref:uncharacterized protein LOC104429400 isoform X3 n=1 Tax=Eucalyptus grandis TaxID=71139 RepID=UPI00192E7935|nr:uncharacterized protein LOC104429400 isoform X3 [Eucalyptus grandis]
MARDHVPAERDNQDRVVRVRGSPTYSSEARQSLHDESESFGLNRRRKQGSTFSRIHQAVRLRLSQRAPAVAPSEPPASKDPIDSFLEGLGFRRAPINRVPGFGGAVFARNTRVVSGISRYTREELRFNREIVEA